jgi:hypothetical protein
MIFNKIDHNLSRFGEVLGFNYQYCLTNTLTNTDRNIFIVSYCRTKTTEKITIRKTEVFCLIQNCYQTYKIDYCALTNIFTINKHQKRPEPLFI